jgi:hypothetical protein
MTLEEALAIAVLVVLDVLLVGYNAVLVARHFW